ANFGKDNQYFGQRFEAGADLHLGPNVRLYGELYDSQMWHNNASPVPPGDDTVGLAIENLFAEVYDVGPDAKTGVRLGRQAAFFGNNLNVRANLSPNIPTPVFDGVRAYRDWGAARLDGFYYDLVTFKPVSGFRDVDHSSTNLWGAYGSLDLPPVALLADRALTTVDLFYFGWRTMPHANAVGSGYYNDRALLTGPMITAN